MSDINIEKLRNADRKYIAKRIREIIEHIGFDSSCGSISETPERFAKLVLESNQGFLVDEEDLFKVFIEDNSDIPITLTRLPFSSTCEHHWLPFRGFADISVLPYGDRVLGVSKFQRILNMYSQRMTIQERITNQVADSIMRALDPQGCAVRLVSEHMCMTTRGVRTHGTKMVTVALRGVYRDRELKDEFFQTIGSAT